MKKDLSIVIATLNEEGNIAKLYKEISNSLKNTNLSWDLIFVDDNSNDKTIDEINLLREIDKNILLIRRFNKRGLSSALLQGALSSNSKYILFMDADLQHNPKYIENLFSAITTSDANLVSASRFLKKQNFLNKKRYKASIIVNRILQKITKLSFSDILTGYFIIEKKFLFENFNKFSTTGFKILLDIILSTKKTIIYKEISFDFEPRYKGNSKLNNKIIIDFVYLILDKTLGKILPARYVIYSFVGLSGAILQIVSFYILYNILGFNLSLALSIVIAMSINFILNNEFTYSDLKLKGVNFFYGLFKFYFFCSFGALFNFLTAKTLYDYLSIIYLSLFFGALVGSVWNYSMNKSFNWKDN